jgi:ParB family transcriptional regulator, chromosome partitioning protein
MRKNLLASVTGASASPSSSESRVDYARRGASRSMMMSIDELAENAKRMVAGDAIVDLDPVEIESSFVGDRLGDDEEDFVALREAIRSQGQSTPILVRPHPDGPPKYMVVFGHRRLRAARELGIQVRAVIKDVEAIAHVVLQGQENSARANLTFIERAIFARRLQEAGQTKDVIKAALSIDDTLLSRMLSVVETVPLRVIETLGPCKGVGRDRWEELKKLMLRPKVLEKAVILVERADVQAIPSSERFERLVVELKRQLQRPQSARRPAQPPTVWQADDADLKVEMHRSGKAFQVSFASTHAKAFGEFISESLDELYRAFKARQSKPTTGD